eukprot:CAMPEP_0172782780 /NCGR_PEP_ID=MMETSP1074-20121228/204103_1 /TAXON_ID=2916 /ORGANISM="Ceratium fusus, Strain PA161109" /LENGTH=417 /DNA_ID=CAMNT_0013619763 /DNA_START=39 /DNA_END=1292 /DNA_ORIENTATION=+
MNGVSCAENILPERTVSAATTTGTRSNFDVKKPMKKLLDSVTDAENREKEHRKYHDHYRIRYFWCAFLPIALMSGFQTIIAGPSDWCWNPQLLRIMLALWTILISGIACYWQWDGLAERHLQSAKRLSNLIAETQHRLCKEVAGEEIQKVLQAWSEKEAAISADALKEVSFFRCVAQSCPRFCCCRCWASRDQHGTDCEETTLNGLKYEDQEGEVQRAFSKLEKWADDKAQAHRSANARFKVMYFWLTFVPISILSSIQAFLAAAAQDIPFLVRLKLADGEVPNIMGIVLAVAISVISGIAGYWKWDAIAKEHEFACKYWIDFKLESQRERRRDSFNDDPGRLLGHLWKKLILNLRDQPSDGGVCGYAETHTFEKWAESVLQPSSHSLKHTALITPPIQCCLDDVTPPICNRTTALV